MFETSNCKLSLTEIAEYCAVHFKECPPAAENAVRTRYTARDIKVPGNTVALLTITSKMPGPSWSLPAHEACPRACGSICDDCYAEKGCYTWTSTVNAQSVRFNWTRDCMRTEDGRALWIQTMVDALRGLQYFRVHDSGDMYSPAYAECWYQVAVRLPETKFWVPTRAWQIPGGLLTLFDPLMAVLRRMAQLANCTVRPSALNFGDYAPNVPGLHAGTSADQPDIMRARQCPAKSQGGHCGECRTCWDSKDIAVNYPAH